MTDLKILIRRGLIDPKALELAARVYRVWNAKKDTRKEQIEAAIDCFIEEQNSNSQEISVNVEDLIDDIRLLNQALSSTDNVFSSEAIFFRTLRTLTYITPEILKEYMESNQNTNEDV